MNRLGIQSLNAGASDLRLSGDQTQRGTYVQRRRNQMAYGGIAGLDGRKAYGIGSWFQSAKDKFVDDIIPNEIKDSPIGTALVGGALLNQFGIPFTGTPGDRMGQNWLGDLLGTVTGKEGGYDTVLNPSTWFTGGITQGDAGIDAILKRPEGEWSIEDKEAIEAWERANAGVLGGQGIMGTVGNWVRNAAGNLVNTVTGQTTSADDVTKGGQEIRWKTPLAIGTAIGAADYLTRSDDTMPEQLAIDPSRFATAEAAKADPNLRFKPQEAYTLKDGGRIGYRGGKGVASLEAGAPDITYEGNMKAIEGQTAFGSYKDFIESTGDEELMDLYVEGLNSGDFTRLFDALKRKGYSGDDSYAQGGRIGAQEGGLMNLGGMEKDYRQEGGFVPIGGEEKADDVPARLSKNEFVFTADAVRAAGGGDIDEGAKVMENLMEHLEAGGKVSEDSQGLEGAKAMFANTQRLQNRII